MALGDHAHSTGERTNPQAGLAAPAHDHKADTTKRKNKVEVDWSLKDLDNGVLVQPQFPLEDGIRMSVGGTLAEQARFGFQDAITNWTRGKSRDISFSTVLFARNEDEGPDIKRKLNQFIALSEPDSVLGRPPICQFSYGTAVSETVLVEAVDPSIKRVLKSGHPQEVELSITLKRYVPFSQKQIDPTKGAKESFYFVASEVERSYEAIARRAYGDPLLGDRLRKRHPDQPLAPAVGSIVRIPAKAIVLSEVVEPASHVLSLTDADATAAFEAILDDRSARSLVVVK